MINVSVTKFGSFPVSSSKIKDTIKKILTDQGMVSDCEVAVAIVGEAKMREYIDKYMDKEEKKHPHPVLSFPANEIEGQFVFPPNGKIHLGEIIISYPLVVETAKKQNKKIDDVACELARHGALHLLGIHHD